MMILILRSSVVNKLTMTSYKELSLALTLALGDSTLSTHY